ncbi:MAG: glycosyltransferase [Planctomycetota bacterium]
MDQTAPALSLILPVYRGREQAPRTREALLPKLRALHESFEVVIVDDGSRDGTVDELRRLFGSDPEVRLIELEQNHGKGYAVREGVRQSRGEVVAFTDFDLPYDPAGIRHFMAAIRAGNDVAIGSRRLFASRYIVGPRHFNSLWIRHAMSGVFNWLVRALTGVKIHDTQCGLKAFHQRVARQLFPQVTTDRFCFDVELLARARRLGFSITELPVTYDYDGDAPSTVRLVRDSLHMFIDLLRIRRKIARSKPPKATDPPPASVARDTP